MNPPADGDIQERNGRTYVYSTEALGWIDLSPRALLRRGGDQTWVTISVPGVYEIEGTATAIRWHGDVAE